MIYVLFILLNLAHADVEVIGGGLTYHILDADTASSYSNKVSRDGRLIANPMIGVVFTKYEGPMFNSFTVFSGQNSVGAPMFGGLGEAGLEIQHLQVGFAAGLYSQESKPFTDIDIHSFRLLNYRGMDLVPILGLAINYKIPLYKHVYLKLNNIISPILTNTTLSVGLEY